MAWVRIMTIMSFLFGLSFCSRFESVNEPDLFKIKSKEDAIKSESNTIASNLNELELNVTRLYELDPKHPNYFPALVISSTADDLSWDQKWKQVELTIADPLEKSNLIPGCNCNSIESRLDCKSSIWRTDREPETLRTVEITEKECRELCIDLYKTNKQDDISKRGNGNYDCGSWSPFTDIRSTFSTITKIERVQVVWTNGNYGLLVNGVLTSCLNSQCFGLKGTTVIHDLKIDICQLQKKTIKCNVQRIKNKKQNKFTYHYYCDDIKEIVYETDVLNQCPGAELLSNGMILYTKDSRDLHEFKRISSNHESAHSQWELQYSTNLLAKRIDNLNDRMNEISSKIRSISSERADCPIIRSFQDGKYAVIEHSGYSLIRKIREIKVNMNEYDYAQITTNVKGECVKINSTKRELNETWFNPNSGLILKDPCGISSDYLVIKGWPPAIISHGKIFPIPMKIDQDVAIFHSLLGGTPMREGTPVSNLIQHDFYYAKNTKRKENSMVWIYVVVLCFVISFAFIAYKTKCFNITNMILSEVISQRQAILTPTSPGPLPLRSIRSERAESRRASIENTLLSNPLLQESLEFLHST